MGEIWTRKVRGLSWWEQPQTAGSLLPNTLPKWKTHQNEVQGKGAKDVQASGRHSLLSIQQILWEKKNDSVSIHSGRNKYSEKFWMLMLCSDFLHWFINDSPYKNLSTSSVLKKKQVSFLPFCGSSFFFNFLNIFILHDFKMSFSQLLHVFLFINFHSNAFISICSSIEIRFQEYNFKNRMHSFLLPLPFFLSLKPIRWLWDGKQINKQRWEDRKSLLDERALVWFFREGCSTAMTFGRRLRRKACKRLGKRFSRQ